MADDLVDVEVAWCVTCRSECTVEVIQLADDPAPVALCVECGAGVEVWWAMPGSAPGIAPRDAMRHAS